jgi:hypothetical protein
MFQFFKSFFGDQADKAPPRIAMRQMTAGLDIDAAILAHENWKVRLDAYLAGRSTEDLRPEVICFDNRCDLGRWIHGPGAQRLGSYPGFAALTEHHRMFHYAASNVVSLAQAGKSAEAGRMLTGLYAQKSSAVLGALRELQAMIR